VRTYLVLASAGLLLVPVAGALSFQNFVKCVSAQGSGDICRLDAGTYSVAQTIPIGRSDFTIAGTLQGALRVTTVQRASGFQGALLGDVEAQGTTLHSIRFRDMTVDGNRAQNGAAYSLYSPDVNINAVKHVEFVNCAFINSPNIGLGLTGAGTSNVVVNKCDFSNPVVYGLWSDAVGDNSNLTYLDCVTKQFVDHVMVANSTFENAGEPAILGEMKDVKILNNVFTNNHSYSIPFNDDGGQIDLTTCTDDAVIIGNIFQNGSVSPNGHTAGGIELHGTHVSIIDNTVTNNSGDGIGMDGAQDVYIANWNPKTGSFGNAGSGISVGHSSSVVRQAEWITIDSAISTGNGHWGIWSDTSNTPTEPAKHMAISNSCLSDNAWGPTFLVNTGVDVTVENNTTTGCGPK
jgi:hypothetical protein